MIGPNLLLVLSICVVISCSSGTPVHVYSEEANISIFNFIPASVLLRLSDITVSNTRLNGYGNKIHPCRTPIFVQSIL